MQKTPASQCDARAALGIACAFAQMARAAFPKPMKDDEAAGIFFEDTQGGLAAAATNISLCLEILLKAEAIVHGLPLLHTHDLLRLFEHLPEATRMSLEDVFYRRMDESGKKALELYELYVMRTPDPISEAEFKEVRSTYPVLRVLKDLLAAEANAFQTWRYIFSKGPVGRVTGFPTYFRRIDVLCCVVEEHLRAIIKTPKV